MNIRKMNINDYNEVYKLWTSTSGMGMRALDDTQEGIEKFLKRNPETNFVAEVEIDEDQKSNTENNISNNYEVSSRIVGVILSGHDGRRGYIYHMAVDISQRGKGIGRLLLDKALTALKEEGINKAALLVFKTNEIGNKFWESTGFNVRDDLNYRDFSLNEENQEL